MLPAKFNKKLWIRRGGYLIIDQGKQDGDNRVTGSIVAVLYEPDVRALKKLPGVWCAAAPSAACFAVVPSLYGQHTFFLQECFVRDVAAERSTA